MNLVVALNSDYTPPRGARLPACVLASAMAWNFYSYAPCGARLCCHSFIQIRNAISTHTPLAGRDCVIYEYT